jgi:hypothetical protein
MDLSGWRDGAGVGNQESDATALNASGQSSRIITVRRSDGRGWQFSQKAYGAVFARLVAMSVAVFHHKYL